MAAQQPDSAAQQHQAGQAALVASMIPLVAAAWSLIDLRNVAGTVPKFAAAIEAIVHRYGRASSAAALNFYRSQRRAAGEVGQHRLQMPAPVERAVLDEVLGQIKTMSETTTAQEIADAHRQLVSHLEQIVLHQGRAAILDATLADKSAKGWARVPEPGACSFCIMLATRGAVYRSEKGGNFRAHTVKADGSGGTCRCHVEPVFHAYEPSAQIRQWQALYSELSQDYKGRDLQIAFRQAVEGRPVTGPVVHSKKKAKVPKKPAAPVASQAQQLGSLLDTLKLSGASPSK